MVIEKCFNTFGLFWFFRNFFYSMMCPAFCFLLCCGIVGHNPTLLWLYILDIIMWKSLMPWWCDFSSWCGDGSRDMVLCDGLSCSRCRCIQLTPCSCSSWAIAVFTFMRSSFVSCRDEWARPTTRGPTTRGCSRALWWHSMVYEPERKLMIVFDLSFREICKAIIF